MAPWWTRVALAALVWGGSGCKREAAPSAGKSAGATPVSDATLLAAGEAVDLRVTPDGQYATFLLKGHKPRLEGIPPQMRLGEAYAVATAGGEPRKLGDGVTNVPGGLLFTPDSRHVLYLTGYNAASQSGELWVAALGARGAEPVRLGAAVTYMLASPDSRQVAFVDGGVLKLGSLPEGPFRELAGEVSTVQFTPDGKTLLFKRRLAAAGGLLAVSTARPEAPRKMADQVGDYAVSPDSKYVAYQVRSEASRGMYALFVAALPELQGRQVASGVRAFAFSPDGKWLARTENATPERLGNLCVGPAKGSPGRKLGEQVEDFSFAPDSGAVGYLERFELSARSGILAVATLPDGPPLRVGGRVPNYVWAPDGKSVAFLSRFIKPEHSVDLMVYPLGAAQAQKAHRGVFGYDFLPEGKKLLFRSNCIRGGRACELTAQPLGPPVGEPEVWAEEVFSYKLSEDASRVLVSTARLDSDSYNLTVYNVKTKAKRAVGLGAQLPAYFAAKDGSRVVYAIVQGPRPGVYAAPIAP